MSVSDAGSAVRPTSAAALGLAAFSLNLFLISVSFTGILPASVVPVFLATGLFYGFVQIMAGMHEYRMGNGFTGLVFASFGAFWMSTALLVLLQTMKILDFGSDAGSAMGLYFVAWTIFTLYLWIGSAVVNRIAFVVFTVLLIALVLFDLAEFGVISIVPGAWAAVLDALLAWYMSAALILLEMTGRAVLPFGPPVVKVGDALG
jgi:succinate-acetate transporter protein